MVHLRIVAPPDRADRVYAMLCATPSAIDVIRVENASTRPAGDLVMCDVAPEDASVIISDLRDLGIHRDGSISLSPDRHDQRLRRRRDRPGARLAGGRGDLGGARPADERERRAVGRVPDLHGAGGRSSRRSGSSSTARSWSSARWSSARSSGRSRDSASRSSSGAPSWRSAPRSALLDRVPARDRRDRPRDVRCSTPPTSPGRFRQRQPRPDEDHLEPGRVRVHRRRLRGGGGHAEPEHRQVRRADRRPDQRHDHPRRGQHRHRRRATATGTRSSAPPASSRSTSPGSCSPAR